MTEQVNLLDEAKRYWPQIVSSLVGEPNKSMSSKDDIRYGSKGSLSIHPSKGVYTNYETGENGGVIDFIKQENHFDTNYQVMTWIKDFLGSSPAPPPPPISDKKNPNTTETQDYERKRAQRKKWALDIWNKSKEIKGTPVEKYLLGRGITLKSITFTDLRYTQCKLPNSKDPGNIYPVMVALCRDIKTDEPVAIHRTYLDVLSPSEVINKKDSNNKNIKAFLGSKKNAAIKLTPDADVYSTLYIAEGIENALSALTIGYSPIWATGNAGSLKHFPKIEGINNLTIFADHDSAGMESAGICAKHWTTSKGIQVQIVRPKGAKHDFNNLIQLGEK
tara:strand:- start:1309 stop:2307 length:999 start_codon:yes stop_codon:yes gene_type:complete